MMHILQDNQVGDVTLNSAKGVRVVVLAHIVAFV